MKIETNDWRALRAGSLDAQAARAQAPMGAGEPRPTIGDSRSGHFAPAGGAHHLKRHRTTWRMTRRSAWEPLLLGGMGVLVAILSAGMILEAAAFSARFASLAM